MITPIRSGVKRTWNKRENGNRDERKLKKNIKELVNNILGKGRIRRG